MVQDPRSGFEWSVPEEYSFAIDVVDRLAPEHRRALNFVCAKNGLDGGFSFEHVALESKQYATVFSHYGIGHGDRVIVALPKCVEWFFTLVALDRLGAIAVPCPDQLRAKDLAYRANHSGARAVVAHFSNRIEVERAGAAAPALGRFFLIGEPANDWLPLAGLAATAELTTGTRGNIDDPMYLIYTSGTTNEPKAVLHTRAYAFAKKMQAQYWLGATPSDIVWCTAATGWAKSLWNVLLGPWSCGAQVIVHEGGFDPVERLNLVRDLNVTILCQAPTEYRLEAKLERLHEWKFPKLRNCVSAGEPLNSEVIERWRTCFGLTILDGYGQTENTLLIANLPGDNVKLGAMGRPTPGHDVAVVDEDGNPAPTGQTGDIGVRGNPPSLFKGYYRNEEATAAARRGQWYLTGDRASVDEDGYFWFVGRADDVISSGAYRIGPFEVESALLEHGAVLESAVVGSPDADRGNIVKAFVVLRPGYEGSSGLIKELQEHCKRVTAPYKYPREIEFVLSLPKTTSGKIRRVELRQAELAKKGATAGSGFS